jgi:hypothetical protein
MSKTFPQKIDKKFDVRFLLVLSRFRVFLSDGDGSSKKPKKKQVFQKKIYARTLLAAPPPPLPPPKKNPAKGDKKIDKK